MTYTQMWELKEKVDTICQKCFTHFQERKNLRAKFCPACRKKRFSLPNVPKIKIRKPRVYISINN